MELTGELKEKVEKAENRDQAKKLIEEAGILLDDEEMEQVSGGLRAPVTAAGRHNLPIR